MVANGGSNVAKHHMAMSSDLSRFVGECWCVIWQNKIKRKDTQSTYVAFFKWLFSPWSTIVDQSCKQESYKCFRVEYSEDCMILIVHKHQYMWITWFSVVDVLYLPDDLIKNIVSSGNEWFNQTNGHIWRN